jgi:hypothetical protein
MRDGFVGDERRLVREHVIRGTRVGHREAKTGVRRDRRLGELGEERV